MNKYLKIITITLVLVSVALVYSIFRSPAKPRLSIITSVWKGDDFIEGFMEDITKQTIFPQSELIMINANSPGNEETIIKKYMQRYPNIIYLKLSQDPGLYGVWNRAIKLASADIVVNANLDDRSSYDAFESHVAALEADPTIDLVYTGYLITYQPNETYANNQYRWVVDPPEFTPQNMMKCLPGPRPVWRKSLHERYGYFDETFSMSADWGMWLRATSLGAKFKKIPGNTTLFYMNPEGLSTEFHVRAATTTPVVNPRTELRRLEDALIVARYRHLWEQPAK